MVVVAVASVLETKLINRLSLAIDQLGSAPNLEAMLLQAQIVRELSAALAAIRGSR